MYGLIQHILMCNQVLMCNFALMQSYFDLYVNVLSLWKCRSRLEDLWSLPTRSATPLAHLVRTALSPVIVDSGEGGLLHPHGRPGHILEMCPPSALHSRCTVSIVGHFGALPPRPLHPVTRLLCGRSRCAQQCACRLPSPARCFMGLEVWTGFSVPRACALVPLRPHRAGVVTCRLDGE